ASDHRRAVDPVGLVGGPGAVLGGGGVGGGDGGYFVALGGRVNDRFQAGWLVGPGPVGLLGTGPGYALAAKLAHPERQVVLLLGDGAFGFAGMELDTLARHGVAVLAVVGNNGIWALEKHPMEAIYGYSVAADPRPGPPYDQVAEALGCPAELVSPRGKPRPALDRALASGQPAVENALTDPPVPSPRRSNLA